MTPPLRVAFVIPHYFSGENAASVHGSLRPNTRPIRAAALDRVIFQLHALFGRTHYGLNTPASKAAAGPGGESLLALHPSANPYGLDFETLVFTTGERHLLGDIQCGPEQYRQMPTDDDPRFLGFECARWIRNNADHYDFCCYLEDDILIRDPLFFLKIKRFNADFGADAKGLLLQPQRYEETLHAGDPKNYFKLTRLYIDYLARPAPDFTGPTLELEFAGLRASLEPALNPSAGCYVVTAAQMARVAAHPDFLDRAKIEMTTMDTASWAFVSRALKIYKPALGSLSFLEVQHAHQSVLISHHERPH